METRKEIIEKLTQLLTRNYDAENGYREAVEDVDDPKLKKFFKTYVEQRYKFGHDLKGEIKNLGGDAGKGKGTSVTGDLHRKWMSLKKAISSNNEEAILEECRKGEMTIWGDYNEALAINDLPPSTNSLLRNHKTKIDEAIFQLMELKAEYA
ncbi:PA2169 family four-helix-bundle protein [Fulvivirga ulvae]|uniref:ferritin-like domain-containing protein n=1 Tax=Fulvivirga ulvae TaxID=2904245 RepID=UPI001F234AAA|nr:PA2169 family four-helix-bundle protein [Fulvivirga ulvae]UII31323.1 PA2169 family four-helix-bundle protein [Fulvivirga ulvae]